MRKYNVFVEIRGKQIKVGKIEGSSYDDACFSYDEDYLSENGKAVSISLPLQVKPFSPEKTRIFFDGLLPEGFLRRTIATNMHFDENDYLSILYNLGRECIGAIRIDENDREEKSGYFKTGRGTGRRGNDQIYGNSNKNTFIIDRSLRKSRSLL